MTLPALSLHLLSAPGREAILAGTLASWAGTDFGETRPRLHLDTATSGHPSQRIPAAWHAMLRAALAADRLPYLLLLEDDLAFVRQLRAALLRWPPLCHGGIATFASLYDPGLPASVPPTAAVLARTHFPADPVHFLGAQALLLARPFAEWAVERFAQRGGVHSRRLTALAGEYAPGAPLPVHRPSLIEHTATHSAWGTRLHRASHFDPAWVEKPPA